MVLLLEWFNSLPHAVTFWTDPHQYHSLEKHAESFAQLLEVTYHF